MVSIHENTIVKQELQRLKMLIGTDGGRDVQIDIDVLEGALKKIEEGLLIGCEDYVILHNVDMWDECHKSLYMILDDFGLHIDDRSSDFDNQEFCIKHDKMSKYQCNYCDKLSTQDEWNEATLQEFPTITPIQEGTKKENMYDYGYSCPKCEEYVDALDIRLVECYYIIQ